MDIKVNAQTVVVFDLDDTLYNEVQFLRSAYLEIATTLEPAQSKSLFARMISLYRSKQDVFGYLSSLYSYPKEQLITIYRNHTPDIEAFQGVLTTFKTIKQKKSKIGIITDGRSTTQRNKIEALGLKAYIDKLIISEETTFEKPNQHNFKCIENFFPSATYYYIADNLRKDFIAPNALGWHTVGLIDNGLNVHHNSYQYFEKSHRPQNFIFSIAELTIV